MVSGVSWALAVWVGGGGAVPAVLESGRGAEQLVMVLFREESRMGLLLWSTLVWVV